VHIPFLIFALEEECAVRIKKEKRLPTARALFFVCVYAIAMVIVIVFAVKWDLDTTPQKTEVFGSLEGRFESDISQTLMGKTVHYREQEITNYLLIGVDRKETGVADYQNGGQADFLLILSIDRRHRTITPFMIDRDTMAAVSTYGIFGNPAGERQMQICLAHAFSGRSISGSRNTAFSVSRLLGGVKMDHYLTMDIGGIVLLNDALGGVTVELHNDYTSIDPSMTKGAVVHLTGKLAEQFVHGRMTVADSTNADRMRRQQTYVDALIRKMEEKLNGGVGFLEGVFDSLSGHIQSDTSENVILSDVAAYQGYEWQPLRVLPGSHVVGEDGFMEFWPDEGELTEMVTELWFD